MSNKSVNDMSLEEIIEHVISRQKNVDNDIVDVQNKISVAISEGKYDSAKELIENLSALKSRKEKLSDILETSRTYKYEMQESKKQPEPKKLQGLVFHEYYVTLVGGMIGQDSRKILVDSVQKEKIVRLFLHIWENYTTNKSKVFDILVGDHWTKYTKQQTFVNTFLNRNWNIEFLKDNVKKYIDNANTVNKTTIAFLNRL